MPKLSLVSRVMIGLLVFGGSLAIMSGQMVDHANEVIETAVLNKLLEARYRAFQQGEPSATLLTEQGTPLLAVYSHLQAGDGTTAVPEALSALPEGFHDDVVFDGRLHYVLVRGAPPSSVYVAYDLSHIEAVEDQTDLTLWVLTLLFLVVSLVVGYFLARAIMAPMHRLARRVQALRPGTEGGRLDDERRHDETAVIVRAINGLLDRIDRFVAREHEFATAASHELRTPIAVISGSADVLAAQPDLPQRVRRPLMRIERAVQNMGDVVTTLLFLAKEQAADPLPEEDHTSVDEVLDRALEDHRYLIAEKPLSIEQVEVFPTTVHAPRGLVSIVINNLVRNAMQHMECGVIAVHLADGVLTIRNEKRPCPPAEGPVQTRRSHGPASNGRKGIGLDLIDRVCARLGWRFTLQSAESDSVTVTVDFGGDAVQDDTPSGRV